MSNTEDIRNLLTRMDESTINENPLVGAAAGIAGRALAGAAIKKGASMVTDILGDDDIEETVNDNVMSEGMSDVAVEIEEWATRSLERFNYDERRVEFAFNKAFPDWAGDKGAIEFLRGILHRADKETPKLMGQDWQQDVRDWVSDNETMDRDRMLMAFRKKFKPILKLYDAESFLIDYLNTNVTESNYPDDFRGIPGEEFDDDRIEHATDIMWEDVDDWLSKREGSKYIGWLMSNEMDDDEKEGVIIDDILPEIQVMIEQGVPVQAGYENMEFTVDTREVKEWFNNWCEKHNMKVYLANEAYESMNGMYEDNADELVNSGAWNKAEKQTKYDPPQTDNKGKGARKGFVG